jgi:hypothetical protein
VNARQSKTPVSDRPAGIGKKGTRRPRKATGKVAGKAAGRPLKPAAAAAAALARTREALSWAQTIVQSAFPQGPFVATIFEATSSIMVYGPNAFRHAEQLREGEDGVDLGSRVLAALDRAVANDSTLESPGPRRG